MAVRGAGRIHGGNGEIRVSDADRAPTDLGKIDISGKVYKPSVFYVLARGDVGYKGIDIPVNFVPRIFKGAQKLPF